MKKFVIQYYRRKDYDYEWSLWEFLGSHKTIKLAIQKLEKFTENLVLRDYGIFEANQLPYDGHIFKEIIRFRIYDIKKKTPVFVESPWAIGLKNACGINK